MNDILYQPHGPWFLLACCTHSELTDFLYKVASHAPVNTATRIFRGTKILTEQHLYDELSAACQFPYYFGENWDALDECLTDLDWLQAGAYVFAFSDFDLLPVHLGKSIGTLLRVLGNAADEWSQPVAEGEEWDRPGRAFHVVLHCVPERRNEVAKVVERYRLNCPELDVG